MRKDSDLDATVPGRDVLYSRNTLCPGLNVGRDILVDAPKRNAVIAEVRRGGEVEVENVPCETVPKPKRESRLEVADLSHGSAPGSIGSKILHTMELVYMLGTARANQSAKPLRKP